MALNQAVLYEGTVDEELKMLVSLIASQAAGCRYCQAHMANLSNIYSASAEKIVAVWEWQTSDLIANHATINAYFDSVGDTVGVPDGNSAGQARLRRPIELDAESLADFTEAVDVIYTANTCHIMSWQHVEDMISNAGCVLSTGGLFIVYGPFHVGGQATSEGNYRFDLTLSQVNAWQGIRDREQVVWTADAAGFSLTQCHDMPANNQLLVFERRRD